MVDSQTRRARAVLRSAAVFLVGSWSSPAGAQPPPPPEVARAAEARGMSESEIAKRSQNPIEDMINIPIEDNLGYGVGSYDRAQNTFKIEPRIPAHVLENWNVITRTIIPFKYVPDATASTGSTSGLGDINPTLFVTPAHPGAFVWGVGPDFQLPTATQSSIGTGKWCVGPALALHVRPDPWTFSMVVSNIWSFAGESDRSNVNEGSLQYWIYYNLGRGWTLKTSPTITAEWNKSSDDVWTVPVGGGFSKVFKIGKVAINPGLQAYGYPLTPSDGPDWEIKVEASILFPE
jgi:hypothetical protein